MTTIRGTCLAKKNKKFKGKYPEIYELSYKYRNPQINLRDARILDDYGDEEYATRLLNHRLPEYVVREDFDFYGWVYAFMNFDDLLFYIYPMLIEFEGDSSIDVIDSFFYSLERLVENGQYANYLDEIGVSVFQKSILKFHEIDKDREIPWWQCTNLCELVGIKVEDRE